MEDAKYKHIAQALREDIRSGVYPVGSVLPSRSMIVGQFGVSPVTAQSAIRLLVAEGLVRVDQGRGAMVISDRVGNAIQQLRRDALMSELHSLRQDIEKYWDMATRDGYLHPATIDNLPGQACRIMIEAHRLWDGRLDDEPAKFDPAAVTEALRDEGVAT